MEATLTELVEITYGARVRLLKGWAFPDHQRAAWLGAADAYVSVRRSGAWDPLAADAIALGRSLVAVDFGSSSEVVRAHGRVVAHSRLVDDPRHPGCRWADPDFDALRAQLRSVYEQRDALAVEARARASTFAAEHSIDASADRLIEVIEQGRTFTPRAKSPRP